MGPWGHMGPRETQACNSCNIVGVGEQIFAERLRRSREFCISPPYSPHIFLLPRPILWAWARIQAPQWLPMDLDPAPTYSPIPTPFEAILELAVLNSVATA